MGFFNKLKELKYREEIGLVEELIQNNAWINELNIEKNAAQIVQNCRDCLLYTSLSPRDRG